MRRFVVVAVCLILLAVFLWTRDARAADECIPTTQLAAVKEQRNAALDQVAALLAQAKAEIERLTKELEAAKKPKDEAKK